MLSSCFGARSLWTRFCCVFVGLFFMLVLIDNVAAQVNEPERVLIRNVRLLDRDGKAEDKTVSILIKDGQLDLVTMDDLPDGEADLVLDAQNGLLMGHLNVGQPPSFMIVDKDPREDFEVLLDTNTYVRFAVHKGVIVRNLLIASVSSGPEHERVATEEPSESRWFAYTPPPLALPISYQDNSKWNKWESKWVSGIFLGATLLDRQYWISQDDDSEQQVGDLDDYDGGEIRGLRLGFVGTLNFANPWVYTVFASTNAFDKGFDSDEDDDLKFLDWRLDIPIYEQTSLSIGKQKEPISMERMTSLVYLPWQERSAAADAFMPARNIGVVLSGTALNQRMTWAGGVFNDWLDDDESFNNNTNQYVGRVTCLPYVSEDERNLLHLGFGLRYSDAKEGGRYMTDPEFTQSPVFVDTGFMEADDVMAYNLELSWRTGPFWLSGEYIINHMDAPELGNPVFDGYHISWSWIITGEMRAYNKKSGIVNRYPIAQSVNQGGLGAWESAIRWSSLDLADGKVDGGKVDILSLGLNWWLSSYFATTINYRHILLDRYGLSGTSDGLNIRIVLLLE